MVVGRLLGVDAIQIFSVVSFVVDSSLVVMVLLGDLDVGVAAEVENVGDVSVFDKDTGDCVTVDDGVDPENEG